MNQVKEIPVISPEVRKHPSFAEWKVVLDANPGREELEWIIRWSGGWPEMQDNPSLGRVWDALEKAEVSWDADLLYKLSLSGDGPAGGKAWRWLVEHPAGDLRVLEKCGYTASVHGDKWFKAGDYARMALRGSTRTESKVALRLAGMQGRAPNPRSLLRVAVDTYNERLRMILDPARGGGPARAEVFLRLLDDGWQGNDEELLVATRELG